MKKFLITMLVMLGAMTVIVSDADARRLGGRSSIGRQSQSVSKAPAPAATPSAPIAASSGAIPPKPASPWKGILGGVLGGLALGALFSHLGIGGGMGSILMIGLLVLAAMFLYRMFRGRNTDSNATPAYAGGNTPEIGSRIEPYGKAAAFESVPTAAGGSETRVPWGIPADFDVRGFLRNSKTYFIRLQAAWDKADINDIREFTTPEMFAELRLQIQERGASPNHTDVVSIDAELMGVETIANEYLASVKFTGMIKEAEDAPAEPFSEVWNLAKPASGPGGWTLAGIQQLQ